MIHLIVKPTGIHVNKFPEMPDKSKPGYQEFSFEYYMSMYQKSMDEAKRTAVLCADQEQAKQILASTGITCPYPECTCGRFFECGGDPRSDHSLPNTKSKGV